jgi:polyribonucleotide nucleotidyltransferase
VHISKLGKGKRINNVEDVLTLGQEIEVIVEEIDEKGKVSLTPGASWNPFPNGDGGSAPAAAESAPSSGSSDPVAVGDRPVAVSFDDAFDAELAGELGDLGPGGEAGGGAADRGADRGDRGPRRDDRGGARNRGPRRHR